jgi:hypothetical protein
MLLRIPSDIQSEESLFATGDEVSADLGRFCLTARVKTVIYVIVELT